MKKFNFLIFVSLLILNLFLFNSYSFSEIISPEKLVSQAMDKTLMEMNNPYLRVIKQGSWISLENFRPITSANPSDFDSRLFITSQDIPKEEALNIYKRFRLKLQKNIIDMAKRAGYDPSTIGKIRALTNFYPPEQLMKNFSTTQQALDYFLNKGIYPSLGEVGEEGAEGLYGKYTKFIRQSFEEGNRVQVSQLILDEDGGYKIIHKSTAAAEHLIEGKAPKNITGFVQAAQHAIEESKKALKSGQFDIAEKQLKRASDALKEARTLVNASTESELLQKINSLENIFKNIRNEAFSEAGLEAGELVKKLDDIAKKLKPIEAELLVETNALKNLKDARNPKTRYLLKGLLDNDKKFIDLKSKLTTLSDDSISKGFSKEFGIWFGATLLDFWNLKQLDDAIKKGEVSSLNLIIPGIINYLVPPTTPIGWAVLFSEIYMATVSLAIQYVESTGYFALVAGQDCMDLIAGIYTLKGREHRIFEKRCEEIVDSQNLACRIYDHHGLRRHIMKGYNMNPDFIPPLLHNILKCHSDNASIHYDEMNQSKHDERISRALVEKCTPIILQEWFEARQIVVNELDLLRQNLAEADLKISVKPDTISKNTVITLAAEENYVDILESEIKDKIRCLGGVHADPKFNRTYKWIVNGKVSSTTYKNHNEIFLKEAGSYELCVDVKYDWRVSGLPKVSLEDGISGSVAKNTCAQVVVTDDKKGEPKACTYTYSDWGECNPLTKKQTRRVVSMLPKGCIEMDEPVLTQSCIPIVKETPACAYQYSEWSACDGISKKQTRRIISKSPVNCIEKEKPMLEQSCTPVTKASPPCSFKYSEWGECSRATKKQTRSVVAREPAGCIEHSKPALEQGCTPPPTEEEKRQSYLNCLCACTPFWQSPPWYGSQNCAGRGPCESRTLAYGSVLCSFIKAKPECAASCYKNIYGTTGDTASIEKDIRDTNRKHKHPLKIKLSQEKCPVHAQLGDIVNFSASVEGGIPPHRVTWSGEGSAKDNTFTFAKSRQPGAHIITATVTDDDGVLAVASCTVIVDAVTVILEKTDPKKDAIELGGKASFKVTVKSGKEDLRGKLVYHWQPHPEINFGEESENKSSLSVTFTRLGKTKIWVDVLKEIDGKLTTVGESNQITIDVIKPKLKLSANKTDPLIGEKVVLTVHEEPKMDDKTITFWWEYSGNISNPGVEPNISNSRAYSFKPKDTKPVTVTVHAKAKDGGDDLGQAKITITPKSYSVAISEPRYLGPKPRIWKCDIQLGGTCPGLVEVGDTQFAVFRDIFMKAIITPSPDSPRYRWTIDPSGSCGFPGSGSEIKINCSNTGTYTVKVEVANADGAKLGEASQAVTVSISQEQLAGATKSKEAYDKMQQAKQLVVQGKLDEGITLAEEASRLDPKNTEAKSLSDKWKDDVKAIRKHIVTSEQLQKDNMLAEAERELQAARALHPKYPPLIEADNRLKAKKEEINKKKAEAQRLKTEGEALERQGNLQSAVNKYKESIRTVPNKTLEEHIRKLEIQIAQNAQKKTASDRLWDECAALAKQGRNQEALQKCRESLNYWSDDKRISAVRDLEKAVNLESQKKTTADRLWDECSALAKQNRLNEALSKCKESLNHWSSDKRISATKDLENTINQATQKKAISDRLWDECAALAKQGRNQEALQKCRESLNYWSNEKRVAVVKELENKVKQATAIQPPIAPPAAPPTDSSGFTGSGNITSTEKQKGNVIFDNGNIGGVYNNPTKATVFTINQPHVITLIQNYHWNNAKGSTPGTIAVKSQSGKMYGPWQAKGSPGQGGVPNAYWTVYPNITLPAGTYTVIDSTPSTWAQNSGSNGAGFTRIEGYPVSGGGGQQSGNTIQQGRTITAEFVNSSPQNIHIFVEGQDTFGSHNRITPNERKRVNIKAPAQAGFIKFNAGRNGQVLASCRWEYDPDNISGRIPVVTFSEPNKLSCVSGMR
jgi:hypothetical protein